MEWDLLDGLICLLQRINILANIPTLVFTTRGGCGGVVVGDVARVVAFAGACLYPIGMSGGETGKYQNLS
jgi:hypothetical protein